MQTCREALLDALSPDERAVIFSMIDKLENVARRRDFAT